MIGFTHIDSFLNKCYENPKILSTKEIPTDAQKWASLASLDSDRLLSVFEEWWLRIAEDLPKSKHGDRYRIQVRRFDLRATDLLSDVSHLFNFPWMSRQIP